MSLQCPHHRRCHPEAAQQDKLPTQRTILQSTLSCIVGARISKNFTVPCNYICNPVHVTIKRSHLIYISLLQEKIEAINQALVNEYEVRRKMLLKRLDVTVQSFGWSDKAKSVLFIYSIFLANVYPPLRSTLATKSKVSVAHLFAAREDLSKIMRTSSGRIREKTACVLMGRVPDRGGRPTEIEAPPPEMPTWQKRQDGPQGGGHYGSGGRGGNFSTIPWLLTNDCSHVFFCICECFCVYAVFHYLAT
uniref:Family with sequence similarity 98 member B n=1 Tax=Oncorhynchus tshawytscha TaxID=74940 RepID=A0AAZ3QYT1_ONCTS